MLFIRETWNDIKWPLFIGVCIVAGVTGLVMLGNLIDGPRKPPPPLEVVGHNVDRFQTETIGGVKVTCFIYGVRGGISCVPEKQ